ncbi:neuroglian-like [Phlebotomus argentipes]|uniref:neuroglian-like n=1 Tax=Phlebotomus argentipes TaxID=94469 RepID=UPI002892E1D4|nr:neuroglian-like [Phlebotomus argentipes]
MLKISCFIFLTTLLLVIVKAGELKCSNPTENPHNFKGTPSKSGCIVLSWKPVPKKKQGCGGLYYRISWGLNPEIFKGLKFIRDWTKSSYEICDLEPKTEYFVMIVANNIYGEAIGPEPHLNVYSG